MALSPNSTFGPYRIGGSLGVGGMGEVYRATDRIARFEREAKSLAALNHSNIAAPDARRVDSMPGNEEWLFAMAPQDGTGSTSTELIFVENWIEEVKRWVPKD